MKIIFYLFLVTCMLVSCNSAPKIPETDMAVLFDMTDPVRIFPTATELLSPCDFKKEPNQGLYIELSTISDRDYNNTIVLRLQAEDSWQSNSMLRKATIKHFTAKLQSCLTAIQHTDTSGHSIIFRAVIAQAAQLTASKSHRKMLLLYSNLYENDEINFYKPGVLKQLRDNPSIIAQQLEHQVTVPSLKGIEIWLIYNASDYQDNNHYVPIARLYKSILEAQGAVVHVATKFQSQ